MPDIIYRFHPIGQLPNNQEVPLKPYPIHGKFLRDIPILPDNISSDVEEFRVEAWRRMDRRIRDDDITDRMHPEFRITADSLNRRSQRFRKAFYLKSWLKKNRKTLEAEEYITQQMLNRRINPALNSTRGMTPGLIDPDRGEDGGRIPVPDEFKRIPSDEDSYLKSLSIPGVNELVQQPAQQPPAAGPSGSH